MRQPVALTIQSIGEPDDPPLTPGRGNRRGGVERAVVAPGSWKPRGERQ